MLQARVAAISPATTLLSPTLAAAIHGDGPHGDRGADQPRAITSGHRLEIAAPFAHALGADVHDDRLHEVDATEGTDLETRLVTENTRYLRGGGGRRQQDRRDQGAREPRPGRTAGDVETTRREQTHSADDQRQDRWTQQDGLQGDLRPSENRRSLRIFCRARTNRA
ncbi:MAG: hypothetical protein CMJ83_22910 [Planctomycetes bacterium]|nr:hypothetical protein [Planctomycetota bacterium]